MGEADAVPVQLDDVPLEAPARAGRRLLRRRRAPPARAWGATRADAASNAARVSRGSSISRSRTTDASVPGSGSRRLEPDRPAANRASQLEREHRVPARQLAEPPQLGSREDEIEPVAQEAVQRAEAERADPQPPQPLLAQRAFEVERGAACFRRAAASAETRRASSRSRRSANSRTKADGRSSHWRSSIATRPAGTGRALAALPTNAERDGPLIRGRALRLLDQERHRERLGLRARKRRQYLLRARLPAGRRAPRTRAAPPSSNPGTTARGTPRSAASSTPRRQSVVLPMPASPSSSRTAGRRVRASRNSARAATSSSRPTTSGFRLHGLRLRRLEVHQ